MVITDKWGTSQRRLEPELALALCRVPPHLLHGVAQLRGQPRQRLDGLPLQGARLLGARVLRRLERAAERGHLRR